MAKGQKALQTQATTTSQQQQAVGNAAQTRLVTGSPELTRRKEMVAARRASINAGDLRNAKDFVGNNAETAQREQQRSMRSNVAQTGVAGLASNYADPTQVALAEKMNKDEFARDSAAQNEQSAKEYMAQTDAMETDLINTDINVNSGIMNSAFGNASNNLQMASAIASSRASVMPSLVGSIVGGGASVLAGSNRFQGGGKPK